MGKLVQIDGRTVARIDESVRAVDIRVEGPVIEFIADGRPLARAPR